MSSLSWLPGYPRSGAGTRFLQKLEHLFGALRIRE
jgi:hypothetical protein